MEEIRKLRKEKSRERKNSPLKDEVENLKKTIKKMVEEDKTKELKHQEELKRLNVEILKLRQKVSEYERKANKLVPCNSYNSNFKVKSLKSSPEKLKNSAEGKIRSFVERNKAATTKKKENIVFSHSDIFSVNTDDQYALSNYN